MREEFDYGQGDASDDAASSGLPSDDDIASDDSLSNRRCVHTIQGQKGTDFFLQVLVQRGFGV
mgnify:CR=1 FL=1